MLRSMVCVGLFVVFFAITSFADAQRASVRLEEVKAEDYAKLKDSKGVVLLGVNWNRKYGCRNVQFAQLQSIAFERMPLKENSGEPQPDLLLDDSPGLLTVPGFNGYALLIEPGEYALSGFDIKGWKSATKVEMAKGNRSNLFEQGKPVGGTFEVRAGEIVYIGHFWLACLNAPIAVPWRQYLSSRVWFDEFLADVKKKFPALETEKAVFRLFRTELFGQKFQLPEELPKER